MVGEKDERSFLQEWLSMGGHLRDAARRKYQIYTFLPWVRFIFAYGEFLWAARFG